MKVSGAPAVEHRRALVLIGFLVLIWGFNWPINKVILTYISPLWFAALRLAMGAISLFLVQIFQADGIKLPARRDLPVVLSIGLVQMAAVLALMTLGLADVPAGRSAILSYTTPLWVVPGSILILGERPGAARSIALLLGLAGVVVLFNPVGFDWGDRKEIVGNGYLLLAAMLWAATIVHVRAHRWSGTPLALAPWQMLIGLVPLLAVARFVEGPPPHLGFSVGATLLVLYSGPLITAFPFWAVITVARALPALTTSLTLLLVPVIGLLSSALLLSEPMSATLIIGLSLIVSSVAAVSAAETKKAST